MSALLDSTQNILTEIVNNTQVVLESSNNVLTDNISQEVITLEPNNTIVVSNDSNNVVTVGGTQGIQGIQGESVNTVYYLAAINIGGNRVVSTDTNGSLVYPDTSIDTNTIIGISKNAANTGDPVEVQIVGSMTENSWNWVLNAPIFIATNGMLTQTPPISGLSQIIGYPVLSNKIFIDKQQPILLG